MGIKASAIIVGNTVVDTTVSTTPPPRRQYTSVRDASVTKTEVETNNKNASQYMLDMGAADRIDSLFD